MTIHLDVIPTLAAQRGLSLEQLVSGIVVEYLQSHSLPDSAPDPGVLSGNAAVFSAAEIVQMLYDPTDPTEAHFPAD